MSDDTIVVRVQGTPKVFLGLESLEPGTLFIFDAWPKELCLRTAEGYVCLIAGSSFRQWTDQKLHESVTPKGKLIGRVE